LSGADRRDRAGERPRDRQAEIAEALSLERGETVAEADGGIERRHSRSPDADVSERSPGTDTPCRSILVDGAAPVG